MTKEERLKLEIELLLTKSKAQMINFYLDELDELRKQQEIIDKIKLIIKGTSYGGNEEYYIGRMKEILQILENKGD